MQGSARDFLKPKLVDSVELSKNESWNNSTALINFFSKFLGNFTLAALAISSIMNASPKPV